MRILVSIMMILSLVSPAWAISWESNLDDAFKKAKAEGKPVMADFYTDWCGWCKKLDKDIYESRDVELMSTKFICVKVNCEKDKTAALKYSVRGYPTIIFFSPDGDTIETIAGYRPVKAFMETMNNVLQKVPSGAAK